jgi:hypothetical protein
MLIHTIEICDVGYIVLFNKDKNMRYNLCV